MSITFLPDCDGAWRDEPGIPQLNVANGNAGIVLDMMGKPFDYCGKIPAAEVPLALAGVLTCARCFVRDTVVLDDRWIDCGVSETQVRHYRLMLEQILSYCIIHNLDMAWG